MEKLKLSFWISLIILSQTLIINNIVLAQRIHRIPHPNTGRIAERQTRIMEKRMALSPEQSRRVNSINASYLKKVSDLQQNSRLSEEEKINNLQTLREEKAGSMKIVLHNEQYKNYLQLHQELQDQRSKRIQENRRNTEP